MPGSKIFLNEVLMGREEINSQSAKAGRRGWLGSLGNKKSPPKNKSRAEN